MSRRAPFWMIGLVAVLAGFSVLATRGSRTAHVGAAEPPPLVVDEDEPLLLDDYGPRMATGQDPDKQPADNSACYVCHANYETERLVKDHVLEEVGCVECHGDSFAHRNDENNITPPDIMFPREKIEAACRECHETHDAPAEQVVVMFLKKCPRDADPKSILCTDCHGEHRLAVRTVIWDKATGKLLSTAKETPTTASQ